VFGAAHTVETASSLWLVVGITTSGALTIADASGQWPLTRVSAGDCGWLPTAGQLKTWLRARGYRVATGETVVAYLGSLTPSPRFVCRLSRGVPAVQEDYDGPSEAEAVAAAVLHVLSAQNPGISSGGW
jgi:hypothetical protein